MGPCQLGGVGSSSFPPKQQLHSQSQPEPPLCMGLLTVNGVKNKVGRNLRTFLVHPAEGRINSTCIPLDRSFSSLFIKLPGSPAKLPHGSFTLSPTSKASLPAVIHRLPTPDTEKDLFSSFFFASLFEDDYPASPPSSLKSPHSSCLAM